MPRLPTGRGRGRPKGSGELGESLRLTVRIPLALYERLAAFAEGRSYTRGAPELAFFVREALVAYLDNKGQTKNAPSEDTHISGQTINVPEGSEDNSGQTKKAGEPRAANLRQTEKVRGARSDLSGRILALLGSHPEGLSASELRVYLKPEKPLGDTLQGMRRRHFVRTEGSGRDMRYFLTQEGRAVPSVS